MKTISHKTIKAIVADNELQRLRITFEDGSLGQLTYKQIEILYGSYYLPDMGIAMIKNTEEIIKENNQNVVNGTMTHNEAVNLTREFQSQIVQAITNKNYIK